MTFNCLFIFILFFSFSLLFIFCFFLLFFFLFFFFSSLSPHFSISLSLPQTEKAFQKQPSVFQNKKRVLLNKADNKESRFWRNVGLGFKTPREAIEGTYIDKKCPFTGNVSIRGRILTGVITKNKMKRTLVVRRDYLHYIKKYNRFEKRHRNISAHVSPAFKDIDIGDSVVVGQCRPLSKTVRFNVLKVVKDLKQVKAKKQFNKF